MESLPISAGPRSTELQLEGGSFGSRRGSVEYQSGLTPSRFAIYARLSDLRTQGYRYHSSVEGKSAFVSAGYFGDHDILKFTATTGTMRDTMAYLAVPVTDRPLKRLREVAAWTAAAMAMPEWPEWIDPARSRPISPAVEVMGQERNTLRMFIEDDRPPALGVHVIGDARCQTDSLFAWGCGNALMAAGALADAIAEHPGDDAARALALAAAVDAELADRYRYSVARDRARDRVLRGESRWDTMETGIGLIDGVLLPAADHDADVFRAVNRWDLQLDPAGHLETDASVIERARAAVGDAAEPALDDEGIPTREQLLAAMAKAG